MEHIDWMPRKWRSGTRGLTPEQKIVYFEICNEIYLLGEAIPEDLPWLAAIIGMRPKRLAARIEELILLNKISRLFGENLPRLLANHCKRELEECSRRIETRKNNGKLGGRPKKNQQLNETTTKPPVKPECYVTRLNNTINPLSPQNLCREEGSEETDPSTSAEQSETETKPSFEAKKLAADGDPFPAPGRRDEGTNPRAVGNSLRQRGVNPRNLQPQPLPPAACPVGPSEVMAMFETMRAEIGETAFRIWLSPLEVGVLNGTIELRAPSPYHRSYVLDRYSDRMRTIAEKPVDVVVFCRGNITSPGGNGD